MNIDKCLKYAASLLCLIGLSQKIEAEKLIYLKTAFEKNGTYQVINVASIPSFKTKPILQYKVPFHLSLGLYDVNNVFLSANDSSYLANLKTNKTVFLGKMFYTTAYKDINKLIYLKPCHFKMCLYSADITSNFPQDKTFKNETLLGLIAASEFYYPIFRVSKDEVLFLSSESPSVFMRYNFVTKEKEKLIVKNCLPELWREKTKMLLCYNGLASNYFYVGLNAKQSTPFTVDANLYLYIPYMDSAIAVKGFLDTFYTRIYSFSENRIKKLPNDEIDLSPGSAVVDTEGG